MSYLLAQILADMGSAFFKDFTKKPFLRKFKG